MVLGSSVESTDSIKQTQSESQYKFLFDESEKCQFNNEVNASVSVPRVAPTNPSTVDILSSDTINSGKIALKKFDSSSSSIPEWEDKFANLQIASSVNNNINCDISASVGRNNFRPISDSPPKSLQETRDILDNFIAKQNSEYQHLFEDQNYSQQNFTHEQTVRQNSLSSVQGQTSTETGASLNLESNVSFFNQFSNSNAFWGNNAPVTSSNGHSLASCSGFRNNYSTYPNVIPQNNIVYPNGDGSSITFDENMLAYNSVEAPFGQFSKINKPLNPSSPSISDLYTRLNAVSSTVNHNRYVNPKQGFTSYENLNQNTNRLISVSTNSPTSSISNDVELFDNISDNDAMIDISGVAQYDPSADLIMVDERQYASSDSLFQIYLDYGSKYYSTGRVYEFIDFIKILITDPVTFTSSSYECATSGKTVTIPRDKHIGTSNFLRFLKSWNSQSNNTSHGRRNEFHRRKNDNAFFQGQPLVLCATKNGKLELLSPTHCGNMLMKRGDMVIIDGDRGKDLATVIEPQVGLDLALFVNFLKKKVHFDSLVTSNIHHNSKTFIRDLCLDKEGKAKTINNKTYDIVELTELVIPSKQVVRFATSWEASSNLHHKLQDEMKALHVARTKLAEFNQIVERNPYAQQKSLTIRLLNAEYQFDRKKLTFFYVCDERNDFRDLIKDLFKFYKTRIWLCAIPNNLQIEEKYYNNQLNELRLYQSMVGFYELPPVPLNTPHNSPSTSSTESIRQTNLQSSSITFNDTKCDTQGTSTTDRQLFVPSMKDIELDNFQIGVYHELLNVLF